MTRPAFSLRHLTVVGAILLLAACDQSAPLPVVASNPPPVPPGANATWFHVGFDNNSVAINPAGQQVVADATAFLQSNPGKIATIVGRTDTVGSRDYNMRLSHKRADVIRDALVYRGNIPADRVETRWTGETRQAAVTANDVAAASNRVVDIAIH